MPPKRTTQPASWTAVDAYTLSHTHPSTRPNTTSLTQCTTAANEAGLPDHATFPAFAKFLAMQVSALNVAHVLEVGTLGGYTPLFIASMNPRVRVTTVEIDAQRAEVARESIARAGLSERVEVIEGAGQDVLTRLKAEVEAGARAPFGLTYIDADEASNWTYFELALGMSVPGASIYVDNVVRDGKVAEEIREDASVMGSREVIERAGRDERVECTVLQTVCGKGYDGFLWALVKGS